MALHHGSSEDRIRDTDANPFVGEANPAFGSRVTPPRQRLANDPVPSEVAYQLIHDELLLGSARLNLATFVTTCGLHRGWPRVRISRDHRILAVRRNSASRHARRVGRGLARDRSSAALALAVAVVVVKGVAGLLALLLLSPARPRWRIIVGPSTVSAP